MAADRPNGAVGRVDAPARIVTPVESAATRLGRPALAPLVDELARRFGLGRGVPSRITLRGLGEEARAAVADLLGLATLPPPEVRIDLGRLVTALELGTLGDVRAAVELLRGQLGDRAASRAAEEQARADLWRWFERRCGEVAVPMLGPLRDWPAQVRRDGIRGGIEPFRARIEQVLKVIEALDRLPADGVPLASFANQVVGDSHGLDNGQPLARLVVAAIADAAGEPRPDTAEDIRRLWERVRVHTDPLSSTVLTIGLRVSGSHPLEPMLGLHREASEPVVLTRSQLQRWPVDPVDRVGSVFVVENPSIIAEAAAASWAGPPIVCSSGRPSIAVVTLLRQLGAGGAALHQHADFDVSGVGITLWLVRHAGTTPWVMSDVDYRRAVEVPRERPPLSGPVPPTPWAPDLASVMDRHGRAVHEEELSDELLGAMLMA